MEAVSTAENYWQKYFRPTLTNALRTGFYQSLWRGFDVSRVTIDTLHELPVVTKEAIRSAGAEAQVRSGLICEEVFTMGTTGTPLVTVRGNREQEFIKRNASIEKNRPGLLKRAITFNNPYHGSHIVLPTKIHSHRIGIYDSGSFDHARKVLTHLHDDDYVEPHCTLLVGLERCLRAFTNDTRTKFPNGLETYLEYVVSYGEYLPRRWRKIIKDTWNCVIIDRYSLSEIFGGATQSALCGWWHFDPYVIPEVISSKDGSLISEGTGLLVLTTLFPFQEAQPLIRYLTGDLVAVTRTKSSKPGVLAIQPLGRACYGVPIPGSSDWLLTPVSILEAVDNIPEISRIPLFRDSAQVPDPFSIGYPCYKVSHSHVNGVIRVIIQIEVSHRTITRRRSAIQEHILKALVQENELLSPRLEAGSATVEILFDTHFEPDVVFYST